MSDTSCCWCINIVFLFVLNKAQIFAQRKCKASVYLILFTHLKCVVFWELWSALHTPHSSVAHTSVDMEQEDEVRTMDLLKNVDRKLWIAETEERDKYKYNSWTSERFWLHQELVNCKPAVLKLLWPVSSPLLPLPYLCCSQKHFCSGGSDALCHSLLSLRALERNTLWKPLC